MKKFILLIALMLILASASFSQTPDTLYVDGWDYPVDDRGYTVEGNEYEISENLSPEQNTLYPNNPIANPQRECLTGCTGIFSAGDEGDFGNTSKGDHPGCDLNREGGDSGDTVFVSANGIIVDIKISSGLGVAAYSGWVIVVEHYYEGDSINTSEYNHVTTLNNTDGSICNSIDDFTVSIGEWVTRGQPIARIGSGYTAPGGGTPMSPHLHFSIRNSLYSYSGNGNILYPRDNGRGGYGGLVDCIEPCANSGIHFAGTMTAEQTTIAFANMQRDGIIDGTDFIDANRPSTYIETAPEIEWQNTIGGSNYDGLYSIEQTYDGGYILGGNSSSGISGDKTEISLSDDYWIIKLGNDGNIEWQNTIGGSSQDFFYSIKQTSDGGYILGGSSYSGISGDKTELSLGLSDYWVIKLDSSGVIEWQNTIGGSGDDNLQSVQQTVDGGYILGGNSSSGISGDKTEVLIGFLDYWVIKLDSSGVIEWQNTIGGSGDDNLQSVQQTVDGGYILGGNSSSGISGDKTEVSSMYDYWVVKLNNDGNIEWQNTIGGNMSDIMYSVQQTPDGGYILGGISLSSISGDKTEINFGGSDYWVIKLSAEGFIEWENTIGGNSTDDLLSVKNILDGGYILGGTSASGIYGDKNEASLSSDYWVIKINESGVIEWQNTIGGSGDDYFFSLQQTSDKGYILGGMSQSNISGDKTENSIGNFDYWVIKLFGECIPSPEICNTIDDDCDGLTDEDTGPSVSINALGSTTFCQGNSIVLTTTHTGTAVQWYKNGVAISGETNEFLTVSTTGSYTCISSNECSGTASNAIIVTVNKNPPASISAGGPTSFCAGESVTLTANEGVGLSYQWYKGATAITGATNINYTATSTGNYKCRVIKTATGCFKNSNSIAVSIVCKEGIDVENTILYPNPSSNKIYIDLSVFKNTNTNIVIVNNLGQPVSNMNTDENNIVELNISLFPSGLYEAEIIQNGHIIHSEKFIIQ